jgi:hypothetical protein
MDDCPLETYWTVHIETVRGVRYCWIIGHLSLSLDEVFRCSSGKHLKDAKCEQRSENRWVIVDDKNRFGSKAVFYIYHQDAMPEIPDKLRTTVYDHRAADRHWWERENLTPPRPGFKQIQLKIKF